jgi:tetratricopeptide (TPR) repeat protein
MAVPKRVAVPKRMAPRRAALLPLAAALLSTAAISSRAEAQQPAECGAEETGGAMAESTYRVLELAIEDLSNDRYAEAEKRLRNVMDRSQGYERAVIFQTLGFVYAQQEQLKPALEAFEEALAVGALQRDAQEDLMFNVGQIYIADEQYDRGIETIERYLEFACEPPPATAHMMLANAYAQQANYQSALQQVLLAFEKVETPEEQWLQLKLALHYELKEFRESAETLVRLIAISPDSGEYWKQLSGVLLEVEEQEEALAVLAVAERQGMLETERDLKSLAGVYLLLEIPYKAGKLIDAGMKNGVVETGAKNYEYLADAWIAAHEWDLAEGSLRNAAELGDDGDLWKRLAQVLMEKEDWKAAKQALEQALSAGVSDTGQTHYLLGVAAFQAGDKGDAESALRVATRDPASQEQAQQWLDHIAANR